MKNELKGKIINEFVGLKSKMYSLGDVDGGEVKEEKGVNESVIQNTRHKEFVDVMSYEKLIRCRMKRIQIKVHKNWNF